MAMSDRPADQFSIATRCLDEAAQVLSGAYAPVRVHTQSPGFDLQVRGVSLDGLQVFGTRSRSGVVFESESSFDGYSLSSTRTGHQAVETFASDRLASVAGESLLLDSLGVTRVSFSEGLLFRGVAIGSEALHRYMAERVPGPVGRRLVFNPTQQAHRATLQAVEALGDTLLQAQESGAALLQAPLALCSLRNSILHLLLTGVPHNYSERLQHQRQRLPAPRHVLRAMAYMQHNAGRPITMSEVAAAAAVSVRALQQGFQHFRATTPTDYLRDLRLQQVRRELLDPQAPGSVSSIALRWGFAHLGLFAARYKARYGEAPSATLRARAGRARR